MSNNQTVLPHPAYEAKESLEEYYRRFDLENPIYCVVLGALGGAALYSLSWMPETREIIQNVQTELARVYYSVLPYLHTYNQFSLMFRLEDYALY